MAVLDFRSRIRTSKARRARCLFLGTWLAFTAGAQTIDEYQVKAAFLYNFARFVDWPPQTFKADQDPIRICVLGHDPFGSLLGDAVSGKNVLGRALVIAALSEASKASGCHILFIGLSEKKRLRSIFLDLQTTGILTVGETEGFATQGGIVNFRLEDGRVRLEINPEAAGQAKLRISAKVLNLADIVKGGAPK